MKELIEIQSELKAPKNQKNTFGKYNYRSCEDILEAVKPLLKNHGCTLTISDEIVLVGSRVYVKATVTIKDGKVTESANGFAREPESQKGMNEAQITGSASSYARKYALNGLFLIDDTKDADATNDHGAKPISQQPTKMAKPIAAKPELKPEDKEQWTKAVKFLVDGGLISAIEGKYALTQVNKDSLMNESLEKVQPTVTDNQLLNG
mgnify:CR=1 FL=1